MSFLEMILIAIGLAMDASAVSIAAAASGYANDIRAIFRIAFHFGLFQGIMPLLGWVLGSTVVDYVSAWDHWIAFILLGIVGVQMIHSGIRPREGKMMIDPSKGWTLVTLSIATSIDALAAGLSFSVLSVSIWLPCLLIGLITMILSVLSTRIGKTAGRWLGQRVEILGGLILFGIGFKILFSHIA